MTIEEIVAKAMSDSRLMGCGCCVYSESYPDDECPTEDGYKDHEYDESCVHGKGREVVVAEQVVKALREAGVIE